MLFGAFCRQRLHESFGRAGSVLALMNGCTGARWSEPVALRPHDYDETNHAVPVRTPLREVGGYLETAKGPKTPAGKRWIQLPPFLDALCTDLTEACEEDHLFSGPQGGLLCRGNFRARLWRPAWDGDPRSGGARWRRPLLPHSTFNEGRHTGDEAACTQRARRPVAGECGGSHGPGTRVALRRGTTLEEHHRGDGESGLPEEPASKTISRISPSPGWSVFTHMSGKPSDLR